MSIFNQYHKSPKGEIKKGSSKKGIPLFVDVLRRELWNLIKLNILFILFCIPMVTIPAATTAINKIVFLMLKDKPYEVFSDFFECFKREFFRSFVVGIMFFAVFAISVFSFQFYAFTINSPIFSLMLRTILVVIIVTCIMAGFFVFPMLAVTDLSIKSILKNAFLLVVIMLPKNLCVLGLFFLLWFITLVFYPYSMPLILLILYSLSALLTTLGALGGFSKYIIK